MFRVWTVENCGGEYNREFEMVEMVGDMTRPANKMETALFFCLSFGHDQGKLVPLFT